MLGTEGLITFALLAALLALADALHLALDFEFLLAILAVIKCILEFCQFLTCQTSQFLIGLSLLYGTYSVLNHGVRVLDKLICLLLGFTYD